MDRLRLVENRLAVVQACNVERAKERRCSHASAGFKATDGYLKGSLGSLLQLREPVLPRSRARSALMLWLNTHSRASLSFMGWSPSISALVASRISMMGGSCMEPSRKYSSPLDE